MSERDSLPPRIGGKYRPLRVIGRGGMGVVYEVEHELTHERLALKLLRATTAELDPGALTRFRREARVASMLKSEHVVRVLDADVDPALGGAAFLVMDLLRGKDLAKLAGQTPQPAERVVEWLRQVAGVIDQAHQLGVVHRDLKAQNIFVAEGRSGATVTILDFGVAKIASPDDPQCTTTGALVGTPLYMSPEQAAGAEVGPPADVWALGLTAYRLLAGRDYWAAPSVAKLLSDILHAEIVAPSARGLHLGPAFDAWFLKSCARDPHGRWPNVVEQVEALAAATGLPFTSSAAASFAKEAALAADVAAVPNAADQQTLAGSATSLRSSVWRERTASVALMAFIAAALSSVLLFWRYRSQQESDTREAPGVSAGDPAQRRAASDQVVSEQIPPSGLERMDEAISPAAESPRSKLERPVDADHSSPRPAVSSTSSGRPARARRAPPAAHSSLPVPPKESPPTSPVVDPLADPH